MARTCPRRPVTSSGDGGGGDGKPEAKREISSNERKDYDGAVEFFEKNEKGGTWNESACRSAADRFAGVVRSHPQMVEAQYMVGLSYQRCGLAGDAEKAYQAALKIKPSHGQSLSNLGELYYRAGKADGAKQYWESAIKANGKLIAARINLASMELEQIRDMQPYSAEWKKLEEDARFQLSSTLGVDSDSYHAYTVYGLIYMEGFQKNKNRLDLARLLLDEGKKRNDKFAPLQNAYGLLYMHKNALSEALKHFQTAVELDPKFIEARMNVGLTTLGFRNYTLAKEQFTEVLKLQPKNYDAVIGLGAALRGLHRLRRRRARVQEGARHRQEARRRLLQPRRPLQGLPRDQAAAAGVDRDLQRGQAVLHGLPDQAAPIRKDVAEAKEQVALITKTRHPDPEVPTGDRRPAGPGRGPEEVTAWK